MNRRDFLKRTAALAATIALPKSVALPNSLAGFETFEVYPLTFIRTKIGSLNPPLYIPRGVLDCSSGRVISGADLDSYKPRYLQYPDQADDPDRELDQLRDLAVDADEASPTIDRDTKDRDDDENENDVSDQINDAA